MKLENNSQDYDSIGNEHIGTSADTPIRSDAFKLSKEEKIDIHPLIQPTYLAPFHYPIRQYQM